MNEKNVKNAGQLFLTAIKSDVEFSVAYEALLKVPGIKDKLRDYIHNVAKEIAEERSEILTNFTEKISNQRSLPTECSQFVDEHFWDLI